MKPQPKTSCERTTKFRTKLYEDKALHTEFKKKDALRKAQSRLILSQTLTRTDEEKLKRRQDVKERKKRSRLSKNKQKRKKHLHKSLGMHLKIKEGDLSRQNH